MIDKNLLKEVKNMTIGVVALSLVMVGVFAVCGYFSYQVVFGALFGDFVCILNFYLLANCVSKAVEKDEKSAKAYMSSTYTLRMLVIAVAIIVAIKNPQYFNYLATAIPLLFPRIVIMFFDFLKNKKKGDKVNERTENNI